MTKTMRTNSIINDPEPYVPALSGGESKAKKAKPNDFEKIANSEDFPQFAHYIESRINHYQKFLPSGKPIAGLSKEKRIEAWESAVVIITEFEALLKTLEAYKKGK